MAWRVVQQPNGRFAIWSDIVDHFTDGDLTEREAFEECVHRAGNEAAIGKLLRAKANPHRWEEALQTIRVIHGEEEAERAAKELNTEGTNG